MFKKMPVLLGLSILLIVFLGPIIPVPVKQAMYALSVTIKSCIIAILPIVIFGLLFRATVVMAAKATWLVGVLLLGTCISTFTAVFLARIVGMWVYNSPISMAMAQKSVVLTPLWNGEFKIPLNNTYVMLAALTIGLVGVFSMPARAHAVSQALDRWIAKILSSLSFVVLPFIIGFIVQLQHEGSIGVIAKNYSVIFIIIASAQFLYLFLVYWTISGFSLRRTMGWLNNMVPCLISGFTTMSSAASMPLLIQGIEKNAKHKQLAKALVPALVNIHWVGECFADVVLTYAVLKTFNMPQPDFFAFCMFSYNFFLLRFACAAVPGGGIVVIMPMLKKYFGFTAPMEGLITALYGLFDPFLTMGNLMGDGAISQGIDRLVTKLPRMVYSPKEIAAMKSVGRDLEEIPVAGSQELK